MADHGEVKLRDVKIQNLIDLYHKTYKEMAETIVNATESGKIQKAKVMATIKAQLADLGDNVDAWAKEEIPQYYLDGANIAVQDLKKTGADLTGPKGLAPINKEAIAALVDETNQAFGLALNSMARNASNIVADAQKSQLNMTIAEGQLKGDARKTIANDVKAKLQENGISALTDSAGRDWSFDAYADMLVRTKAVESRNAGLQNKMLQNGYDLVQVSNHMSSHPACAEWEGQILSVTGQTPGYPTVDEAEADGLMHPNCQHAYNVIDPDIADLTDPYDNPFNYDENEQAIEDFRGPGAEGVKTEHYTVYHGQDLNSFNDGTDLFGNAYYVSRSKSVAKEFGEDVTASTLSIKPSHILTISNDAEYNKLISQTIKEYPNIDIQQAIPKFVRGLGYDAIEGTPEYDKLAGIAIFDRNLLAAK